jgi:hypothetical protein
MSPIPVCQDIYEMDPGVGPGHPVTIPLDLARNHALHFSYVLCYTVYHAARMLFSAEVDSPGDLGSGCIQSTLKKI